ncbi:putative Small monomeric GTPase [Rhodotorula taiwanensis]|uniref:Putative Small monomeric GTPase n=1 Tax=Rhodotorula taiwanensis TaxID=741276 RepID=A0A2S5B3G6_9BASI|nr:putative Small monomeric GTPase [Rhodotorula taiwanensis]
MPALCGLPSSLSSSTSRRYGGGGYAHEKSSDLMRQGRPVVVVGDGACGKTSLLNVYISGRFPQEYEPTIFENHCIDVVVDGTAIELALWDTAGQEDFDRLRSLSYADTNVVLLCFSVDQPASLDNVDTKWIEEIRRYCPGVKLALVALKCDLRGDLQTQQDLAQYGERPVSYEEGLAMARRIRASRYLECSAKYNRGVQEIFEEAARVSIVAPRAGETRGSRREESRRGGSVSCSLM